MPPCATDRPVGTEFPNHLVVGEPCARSQRGPSPGEACRPLLLLGLMLLCLAPRALMAWKLDGVCPDGVAYIRLAELLDQGQGRRIPAALGSQSAAAGAGRAPSPGPGLGSGREPVGRADGRRGRAAAVRLAATAIRPARGPGRLLPLRRPRRVDPLEPRGPAQSDLLVPLHARALLAVAGGDGSPPGVVSFRRGSDRAGLRNPLRGTAAVGPVGRVVGGALAGIAARCHERARCHCWLAQQCWIHGWTSQPC